MVVRAEEDGTVGVNGTKPGSEEGPLQHQHLLLESEHQCSSHLS